MNQNFNLVIYGPRKKLFTSKKQKKTVSRINLALEFSTPKIYFLHIYAVSDQMMAQLRRTFQKKVVIRQQGQLFLKKIRF